MSRALSESRWRLPPPRPWPSTSPPAAPRRSTRSSPYDTSSRATITEMRTLLLLAPLLLSAQTNLPPEPDRQLARDIYKEFIEIKSGYTTGSTTPVAEAAARRLRAAGFPASDIFVGGPIPTKHNLVVRLRGTGARKPILLLAHTDVV